MRPHICLLLSFYSWPAFAETPRKATLSPDDEIVVTALRTPTNLDRVSASITVLDKSDIDQNQTSVLSDVLIRTPGVSFTRNGGYGTATSIRIRGAEADQTALVIDGVRLADPASAGGGYNFANLLTGDIARIEILRGPQSILWGSQAIGGVVNVVTAKPAHELEGSFDLEGGSRRTISSRSALGGHSKLIDWRIAGTTFATDGISAISPRFGGNEKDGYRNDSATGRLALRLAQGVSADLRGYYSSGRTDIDSAGAVPDSPEFSQSEEWIGYAGLNAALFEGVLGNRFSFSQATTRRHNINPARSLRQTTFDALGRVRRYEYQGSLNIAARWSAVLGAEREEQRMRSASPPNSLAPYRTVRARSHIDSVYAQINGEPLPQLTLSAGARFDHHSTFGDNVVLGSGVVVTPFDDNTVLRLNYGEGFKAPTLFQLFSEFGNDALEPEKAHGLEAGIEQRLLDRHVVLAATWFQRTTLNLITFNGCPTVNRPPLCFTPGTGTPRSGFYANTQKSEAQGIELTAAANLGPLSVDANYSWVSAEDRTPGPNFGNQLPRRPRHSANASLSHLWPFGLRTGAAVRWSGKTLDTAQTSATTAPFVNRAYSVVDLRAELPVGHGLTLFGRVENLFDEYYEAARRFGQLGRSFYAGIRGRF